MNELPGDLAGFDFTWSSSAFEHLGSLEAGARFVERQMHCLRPGAARSTRPSSTFVGRADGRVRRHGALPASGIEACSTAFETPAIGSRAISLRARAQPTGT